ncbi:MAG TPA: hypothetical protein VMV49_06800 [Candidatus Deferrimicrobium sp.]|nr:hypothetical protein [Candidatus Deferrimicrobium sp.]
MTEQEWKTYLDKYLEYSKIHDFKTSIEMVAKEFNISFEEAYARIFPGKGSK